MILSRRRLLAAGSTAFVGGVVGAPFIARAQQAEFTYKYANNLPVTHPMNARAREMAATRSKPRPTAGSRSTSSRQASWGRTRTPEPAALRRRRVLHACPA